DDDLGGVELAGGRVVLELLDQVEGELLHGGDLANGPVLVAERLLHLEPLVAGDRVGPPSEHEAGTGGGEGHADGVAGTGLGDDGFELEPLGQVVPLELGVELPLVDEVDGERLGPGGRLRLGELGRRGRRNRGSGWVCIGCKRPEGTDQRGEGEEWEAHEEGSLRALDGGVASGGGVRELYGGGGGLGR